MGKDERFLRRVFLLGAVIDSGALLPMLSRRLARFMWGVEDLNGPYDYAMRFGAGLMAGWTSLLLWAARRPVERRFVAPLTVQVVGGLVAAEVAAARDGTVPARRLVPSWMMQCAVTVLFLCGYARARNVAGEEEAA